MPATIRHCSSVTPAMLAGTVKAIVTRPPRLVAKPWAPAHRTLFSITSCTARSTSPCCSASCLSAAAAAGGSGPTPSMARASASRTNEEEMPGAISASLGASTGASRVPSLWAAERERAMVES